MRGALLVLFMLAQSLLAARVAGRLLRTRNGCRVTRASESASPETISVLVPVLNEAARLGPCLDGLITQGACVAEIVVIDGGSEDGTPGLVRRYAGTDDRIRLIGAATPPVGVNGKAWQLAAGLEQASPATDWILTIDADVRPEPALAAALLDHARTENVHALSVATSQRLSGAAEAVIHPSMLATLVYRFGIPGHATTDRAQVQANGQCFLIGRDVLAAVGGFGQVVTEVCEDVALARKVADAGYPVGFYEPDGLVSVEMYGGAGEAWRGWSRSLPMMDHRHPWRSRLGMAEVLIVQALPPWLLLASGGPVRRLNGALTLMRIGVLAGAARAYVRRPWSYWLSPLVDLPVAVTLIVRSLQRRHTWRGRIVESRP